MLIGKELGHSAHNRTMEMGNSEIASSISKEFATQE